MIVCSKRFGPKHFKLPSLSEITCSPGDAAPPVHSTTPVIDNETPHSVRPSSSRRKFHAFEFFALVRLGLCHVTAAKLSVHLQANALHLRCNLTVCVPKKRETSYTGKNLV